MNILVCIKQVPGTSNVNVDPDTGTLIRDGAAAKMNPYDLTALETALKLKEKHGGRITAVSMGPDSAKEVLKEAIYMGADEGILVSDRKFGGADVLATSYTLGSAISANTDYDLILCGKQTTDGDTAQVGPELSSHLGIPFLAYVRSLEADGGCLNYCANLDNKIIEGKISLPCLICMDAEVNTPRLPSYKRKSAYGNCEQLIRVITFSDLQDQDESHYGLKGSATRVEKIFEPQNDFEKQIISQGDLGLAAFNILKEHKFI